MYATFPHVRRYYIYLLLPYTPSRKVLKIKKLEMERNIPLSSMIQELQVLSFHIFINSGRFGWISDIFLFMYINGIL